MSVAPRSPDGRALESEASEGVDRSPGVFSGVVSEGRILGEQIASVEQTSSTGPGRVCHQPGFPNCARGARGVVDSTTLTLGRARNEPDAFAGQFATILDASADSRLAAMERGTPEHEVSTVEDSASPVRRRQVPHEPNSFHRQRHPLRYHEGPLPRLSPDVGKVTSRRPGDHQVLVDLDRAQGQAVGHDFRSESYLRSGGGVLHRFAQGSSSPVPRIRISVILVNRSGHRGSPQRRAQSQLKY